MKNKNLYQNIRDSAYDKISNLSESEEQCFLAFAWDEFLAGGLCNVIPNHILKYYQKHNTAEIICDE